MISQDTKKYEIEDMIACNSADENVSVKKFKEKKDSQNELVLVSNEKKLCYALFAFNIVFSAQHALLLL